MASAEKPLVGKPTAAATTTPVVPATTNIRYDCAYCDNIYTKKEDVTLCAYCNDVVCNECYKENNDLLDTCGSAVCNAVLCERCAPNMSCASCGEDCCRKCACEDQCPECSDDKLLCEDCSGTAFCNDCEAPLCNDHVGTFDNPNDDDDASSTIKLCKECGEKRKVKPEQKRHVSYSVQKKKKHKTATAEENKGTDPAAATAPTEAAPEKVLLSFVRNPQVHKKVVRDGVVWEGSRPQ